MELGFDEDAAIVDQAPSIESVQTGSLERNRISNAGPIIVSRPGADSAEIKEFRGLWSIKKRLWFPKNPQPLVWIFDRLAERITQQPKIT
jgi:hypothetical protein